MVCLTSSKLKCLIATSMLAAFLASSAAAQSKARPPAPFDGISKPVDLHGRPKTFVPGKRTMYGIWYEDGIWRLRTVAKKRSKTEFIGTVEIDRGKVTPDYSALDKEKKKKSQDRVIVSKSGQKMDFKFRTFGQIDGIDFKVSTTTRTVTFKLKARDDDNPEVIYIGTKGTHPDKAIFTLPAHPKKPVTTDKKSKP